MKVKKRNGELQDFDFMKIRCAVMKAFDECGVQLSKYEEKDLFESIEDKIQDLEKDGVVDLEDIQNLNESQLMFWGYYDVAKAYIIYRYNRALLRKENSTDQSVAQLIDGTNEYWNKENANKRAERTSTQRDYVAGITSTDVARRLILPEDVIKAHDEGIIHFHDIDYLIHKGETNCSLINLQDMLDNGTVINDIKIESPHRFLTACTIATQIIMGVASNQYGGCTISIAHLAPYLRKSKKYYQKKYPEQANLLYKKELEDGVQTFNYQVNSMSASTGQSPFLTVHIDLEEIPEYTQEIYEIAMEFLSQRILGFKNKLDVYITPTFPKIIVVLRDKYFEKDVDEKTKAFIHKCAECTALRMVPDYMSEKLMMKYKGAIVPAMGCRSLLKPMWIDGKLKLWGRFNLGVCTLNLPHVAYSSGGDFDKFWELMNERTELIRKAQLVRVNRIANSTTDVAPLLWQHGAFARLPEHTKLSQIIYGGYASISLGYAGLYECVKIMTGESQSGNEGYKFAEQVMAYLDNKTKKWAELDNLGWSVYGTPIESTTWKFAKSLKKFGYDREYITNSIHIPVFENIDPFKKLEIEGKLQVYSTGGNVNYIESANMRKNPDAIIDVMKAINDHCLYAEINGKNDFCEACGSTEEQQLDDDGNWFCPVCGCTDSSKLYHPRRICGYIQVGDVNKGRAGDIKNRFVHLDNRTYEQV